MAQVLPTNHSFGNLNNEGNFALYMNARLDGTFYSGILADGWSSFAADLGIANRVATAYPTEQAQTGEEPSAVRGFCPIRVFDADQTVAATMVFVDAWGNLNEMDFGRAGVFARANGWSWEREDSARMGKVNASCYAAELRWEPGVNSVNTPEDFTGGSWSSVGVAVTSNTITGPFGGMVGDSLSPTTSSFPAGDFVRQTITPGHPVGYTFSVSFKRNSHGATPRIQVISGSMASTVYADTYLDLYWDGTELKSSGFQGYSWNIHDEGNGWYRASVVTQVSSDGDSVTAYVFPSTSSSSHTVYAWGSQMAPGIQWQWNASALQLRLDRYNSGGRTELAYTTFQTAGEHGGLQDPFTVNLDVDGVGADVDLTATVTGFGLSTSIELTYTDSDAQRITVDGEAGFFMSPTRVATAPLRAVTHGCITFEVRESGSVAWRDEWLRQDRTNGMWTDWDANSPLDAFSQDFGIDVEGFSMMSAFAWDQGSYDPTNWMGYYHGDSVKGAQSGVGTMLDMDTSGLKLRKLSSGFAPQSFLMTFSRPPNSEYVQHRKVTLENLVYAPNAFDAYSVGIALHCGQVQPRTRPFTTGSVTQQTFDTQYGYMGVVTTNGSGTDPVFEVWRIASELGQPVQRVLASYEDTSNTYHPGVAGGTFVLEFEIENVGDPVNGNPTMKLKVGGVQIPLEHTGGPGFVDGSGTVTDDSSNRITAGGEGLYYHHAMAGGSLEDLVTIDDWVDVTTGVSDGPILPPEDMVSESVGTESGFWGAAVGNLHDVIAPDFPFHEERMAHTIFHEFESGHTATYARNVEADGTEFSRRSWTFTASARTEAEWDALLTFYDDHEAGQIPFFWKPDPAGDTFTCVFDRDSIDGILAFVSTRAISFRVLELKG